MEKKQLWLFWCWKDGVTYLLQVRWVWWRASWAKGRGRASEGATAGSISWDVFFFCVPRCLSPRFNINLLNWFLEISGNCVLLWLFCCLLNFFGFICITFLFGEHVGAAVSKDWTFGACCDVFFFSFSIEYTDSCSEVFRPCCLFLQNQLHDTIRYGAWVCRLLGNWSPTFF